MCNPYAGCTLSPNVFAEILERELLETRLCECNFLHSRCELSIHLGMWIKKIYIYNQRLQPGETQDTLMWTSQTAKQARANEARHEHPRLYEIVMVKVSIWYRYLQVSKCIDTIMMIRRQLQFQPISVATSIRKVEFLFSPVYLFLKQLPNFPVIFKKNQYQNISKICC